MEQGNIFIQENGFDLSVSKKHKLLRQSYELRHAVFSRELEWVKEDESKMEVDKFDFHSKHIIISQEQRVSAYMRITPEDTPWLLTDAFTFLIDEGKEHEFLENSVEVTRLAVDAEFRRVKLREQYTLCDLLIKGLLKYSLDNNVKHWYIVVSQEVYILLRRRGMNCNRLGEITVMPDGVKTLAARIDVPEFLENCTDYYLDFPLSA